MIRSNRMAPTVAALAALLFASAVLASPAAQEEDAWIEAGLPGGAVYDLGLSPIYDEEAPDVQDLVATGNDVYDSTRGVTWTLRSGVPDAFNLAAGPDGWWFAATRDGVGYVTRSFGRIWQRTRVREIDDPVRFLAASPVLPEDGQAYAIVSNDGRLYRTDTAGNRWSEVLLDRDETPFTGAVAFSPLHEHDEILFAGASTGLYRSENAGQTWTLRSAAGAGVPAFGADAGPLESQGLLLPFEWGDDPLRQSDPDVDTIFAWNAQGVWTSEDEATSWTPLPLPQELEQVNGLTVSPGWPEDPTVVIAGRGAGTIGAVTSDAGASWTIVPGAPGVSGTAAALSRDFWPIPIPDPFPPLDTDPLDYPVFLPVTMMDHTLPEDPTIAPVVVNREMHIATDGAGVWRSLDEGRTWESSMDEMRNVRPTTVERLGISDGRRFLAGSRASGLFRTEDGGATWSRVSPGLLRGDGRDVLDLEASPSFDEDGTVFAATTYGVWKSADGGTTWADTGHPGDAPVRALAVSPQFGDDRTLFADGYRSTDGGTTWSEVDGIDRPWRSAAVSPRFATDGLVLVGTDEIGEEEEAYTLYRSSDGGASFTLDTEDRSLRGRALTALEIVSVVETEDLRIFAGTDSGLFASLDGGVEWDRADGAPSGAEAHALDARVLSVPFQTAVILMSSDRGVYVSTDRGISFSELDEGPDEAFGASIGGGNAPLRLLVSLRSSTMGTDLELGNALAEGPASER